MKFSSLTPNLMVKNVNETIAYYKDLLGFEFIMSVPEKGQFNWAMVKRDEVTLMFQEEHNLKEELPVLKDKTPGASLNFYIRMEEVQSFYQELKGKVNVISELNKTFYGAMEFSIQDLNGYVLTFSQMDQ